MPLFVLLRYPLVWPPPLGRRSWVLSVVSSVPALMCVVVEDAAEAETDAGAEVEAETGMGAEEAEGGCCSPGRVASLINGLVTSMPCDSLWFKMNSWPGASGVLEAVLLC